MDFQATGEALSSQKRTSSPSNFILALLDPDPDSESGSTDLIQSGSETLDTVPLTVCVFTLIICIIIHVQPSGEEEEDVATSPRKRKPAAGGGRASDGDEVETIQAHRLSDTYMDTCCDESSPPCRRVSDTSGLRCGPPSAIW